MARQRLPIAALYAGLVVLGTVAMGAQDRGLVRVPAPIGPGGQIQNLYTGSYALLVGVSRYQDSAAWAPLESVTNEMADLDRVLKEHGFDAVQQVVNPTGLELRRAIEDFIGKYGYDSGNRLFFFFAGHGHTLDEGARGFFVPRDAPDPVRDNRGFRTVALSMQQIATWAQEITVRHALFAFDSCFSGSIFRTRDRPIAQRVGAATAQPVREFLSAGGAGEPVPARSVFAPLLVRALKGEADLDGDGFVTGTELGNYVQREVIEYRTGQTPQFGKIRDPQFDVGDIVFALPRTGATPPPQTAATRSTPQTAAQSRPAPPQNTGPARGGQSNAPSSSAERPPASANTPARSEVAAVLETVEEYRRAHEAQSVERLIRVYPSLDRPDMARLFEDVKDVRVGMSPPVVEILSPTQARATTRMSFSLASKVSTGRTDIPATPAVFTLQKTDGRWVIVEVRASAIQSMGR